MLIIAGLILALLLPSPWNGIVFAVLLVLGAVEIYLWNRTVRHLRSPVGAETMVGESAVVVTACEPVGQVHVKGETWRAECEEGAPVGATVTIVGRRRLTLLVRPQPAEEA
jgi:membrane protein implicated in regulation of membrane protease activity